MKTSTFVCVLHFVWVCSAGVVPVAEEIVTPDPPPQPYSFVYEAGRFPGHVDRVHAESGDGSGVVSGSFSYIDPRFKVRTVQYTADKNGFHPILSHPVADTISVNAAKLRHAELYNKIAAEHAAGQQGYQVNNSPSDTPIVAAAKEKHANLYDHIAQQHARISAERAATADPNIVDYNY